MLACAVGTFARAAARATATVAVALCCVAPVRAHAQRVRMAAGTLALPAGFVLRELRGTESHPGRVLREDSSLVIHYDIGAMAGVHAHPSHRGTFVWLTEHTVDGRRAYTGMREQDGRRRMVTTILGESRDAMSLPANFEADVRDERDVAEFLLVVTSYSPGPPR